jgi:hypothetical protein
MLLGFLMGLVAVSTTSLAESFEEEDLNAMRDVIELQIEAFHKDDADAAFNYASPKIRSLFPTPDTFMTMVRRGYQPVYRAQRYSFGQAALIEGQIVQPVRIDNPDKEPVFAMYYMERQSDGTWKINGCVLVQESGQGI